MTSFYPTETGLISTNLNTEVSSDGAGSGVSRVGGSQHDTTSLDSIETLPHHGNHGAAGTNFYLQSFTEMFGTAEQSCALQKPRSFSGKIISN